MVWKQALTFLHNLFRRIVMKSLTTKDGRNFRVFSVVVSGENIFFICVDKENKPHKVHFDEVKSLAG